MAADWFRRELDFGMCGTDVVLIQRKLKCRGTGCYDAETEAKVRGVQRAYELPITGRVDGPTSEVIGDSIRSGFVPDWYSRPLHVGNEGEDVLALTRALGLYGSFAFDPVVQDAVRRFQSEHHLPLTGEVDEHTAVTIGDDAAWTDV